MKSGPPHRYLIALGSNMRVPRVGGPHAVIGAAIEALEEFDISVQAVSPSMRTDPVGPSQRRYANAVAEVSTHHMPAALLKVLFGIESAFGRRRLGLPWRARPLDLDIVLWSGGEWYSDTLTIPHPRFRDRSFVLAPAAAIAHGWRDPQSGLTIAQLFARLTRPRPLPSARPCQA